MDAFEPRLRRRGYFLTSPDIEDGEVGETDTAEGFTIRVRIIRPRFRRSGPARRPVTRFVLKALPGSGAAAHGVRSASATGSHRPEQRRR